MAEVPTPQITIGSDMRQEITAKLNSIYAPHGLEIHPFKIGWYNEKVDRSYQLNLHPDTLAYVITSTPDMFENALVPFMCKNDYFGSLDLLDKCMQYHFALAKKAFPDEDVETIHDFEMTPSRRAKILVQPACHVAGAAYYYTRRSLNPDPFEGKTVFGVCIHPKYSGWFAIRGVIIFKSIQSPDLPHTGPIDCVPAQTDRVKLLDLFTNHWKDWRYRDIVCAEKQYSEDQKVYFATPPKDRKPLIMELREKYRKMHADHKKQNSHSLLETDFMEETTVNGRLFSTVNCEKNNHLFAAALY